jgi:hypothetical protein
MMQVEVHAGLKVKWPLKLSGLMKTEIVRHFSKLSNFMKVHPALLDFIHAFRQTDGTD